MSPPPPAFLHLSPPSHLSAIKPSPPLITPPTATPPLKTLPFLPIYYGNFQAIYGLMIMMIQALNPSSTTAKTAEIMSRYRPIAPKPEVVPTNSAAAAEETSDTSQKIRQSPYLRNVWPHLQARPTRTRKRGRTSLAPPVVFKRPRTSTTTTTHLFTLSPPPCHIMTTASSSPAKNLSIQGFSHGVKGFPQLSVTNLVALNEKPNLVTFPILSCPSSIAIIAHRQPTTIQEGDHHMGIDLNKAAEVPEEKDFLQQLQGPIGVGVIAPQPVRPVGSSISVGCINEDLGSNPGGGGPQDRKKREEIEEEVEWEALPAVVSDSNNKVRLANSAYKEMVGQPECSWLDSMAVGDGGLPDLGGVCKRICGEVMLRFSDTSVPVSSSNGFSCWVTIEWGSNGKNRSVHAFCDVIRLSCEFKDYLFAWRFHTRGVSESSSNA
ncbi:hypothetical protein U1Q18_005478 [Sarracenia purpurea var. burkii]